MKPSFQLPDYTKDQIKVVFVGCGDISQFHYDVLVDLGINVSAVSARKDSENAMNFKNEHNHVNIYDDNHEMVSNEKPDAIFIMPSWDKNEMILKEMLGYSLPILVEKPVSMSSANVEELIKEHPKAIQNVQVGYNRRFYDFIPYIKQALSERQIKSVELKIPESVDDALDLAYRDNLFLANSTHVLDLALFLLGQPVIKSVDIIKSTINKKLGGYNGLIRTEVDVPILISANWNSPYNFGIVFHTDHELFQLLPLECAQIFEGFEIEEPSKENPIRKYTPKIKESLNMDPVTAKYKPGFLKQAINFMETAVLKNYQNDQACTIQEALYLIRISEKIMN
ncbi:Gfo/Idh/MocA family oxidoreductase [bacterium AH-315-C07]|nr:Gfo/Idh/MocA family oxidoreductase [bacterium AH-315-C07]